MGGRNRFFAILDMHVSLGVLVAMIRFSGVVNVHAASAVLDILLWYVLYASFFVCGKLVSGRKNEADRGEENEGGRVGF